MPIQWREKLSVGHVEIDDDHKQLLSLLNGVEVLVRRCVAKDAILAFLDELGDYTKIHFAREESMMVDANYPLHIEHKRRHEALIDELVTIREGIDQTTDQEDLHQRVLGLMETLKSWLVEHIIKEDMDFAHHRKQMKLRAAK